MASIFSKIVSGDIPATKVYEDEQTLAFMDIGPASPGHTLVICKEEYPDIFSIPVETLMAVTRAVQQVALALRDALQPDGINIVQNNGAAAGQTVFHYHVHLIPRWEGDGVMQPWKSRATEQDEVRTLAEQIRSRMQTERA
jgi:histidine triad (HIT) family protein